MSSQHEEQKMFKFSFILGGLLSLPYLILAQKSCTGTTATSNSNRKIGIVIDSSGSNADTDPDNLRIAAGKAIVASLLPTDLVTVIDFDSSASIVYPLGAPASATFAGIDDIGDTYIAAGVKAAIDECTKDAKSVTAGVTGIVVLTDGQDYYQSELISELENAKDLGIRVSFGFLSPFDASATQDASILSAILATGGVYSTIGDAAAQASFVSLVLSNGLVNSDTSGSGSDDTILLPGLATAGSVSSSSGPKTFTYDAIVGEKLKFTITALGEHGFFDVSLHAKSDATKVLGSGNTDDAGGVLNITYTVIENGELDLSISTADADVGLFSVTVESSVKRTVTLCGGHNNTSIAPPSGTAPPVITGTGTLTSPPLSTGTGSGSPGGNVTVTLVPTPSSTLFVSGAGTVRYSTANVGGLLLMVGTAMLLA